jgi:hypothetical protein
MHELDNAAVVICCLLSEKENMPKFFQKEGYCGSQCIDFLYS